VVKHHRSELVEIGELDREAAEAACSVLDLVRTLGKNQTLALTCVLDQTGDVFYPAYINYLTSVLPS
jgi:hypothetical protein